MAAIVIRQLEESVNTQGQGQIYDEFLGHIADTDVVRPDYSARRRFLQAQQDANKAGFSRAVRANQGNNLFGLQAERDIVKNILVANAQTNIVGLKKRLHQLFSSSWQAGHNPESSMACISRRK